MGYMRHHAIVVTGYDADPKLGFDSKHNISAAYKEIKEACEAEGGNVSELTGSSRNDYKSFFVAPDGSKELWDESEWGNFRRDLVVGILKDYFVSWVEISFGDDDGPARIIRES